MKIEKLNDKQIRCTLSNDDLATRHLNIGELAYGSDKARSLFREMLTRASKEFGFQADNMPLMIEAVPLSEDSIMLLITKVEDPEEIDTRFAKFAPTDSDDFSHEDTYYDISEEDPVGADEVMAEFSKFCQDALSLSEDEEKKEVADLDFYQVYCFSSIDEVCRTARILCGSYDGPNTLYKDSDSRKYYLTLHKGDHTPETFNKICNILSEYSIHQKSNAGTEAYYEEHLDIIVKEHAIQSLRNL